MYNIYMYYVYILTCICVMYVCICVCVCQDECFIIHVWHDEHASLHCASWKKPVFSFDGLDTPINEGNLSHQFQVEAATQPSSILHFPKYIG